MIGVSSCGCRKVASRCSAHDGRVSLVDPSLGDQRYLPDEPRL